MAYNIRLLTKISTLYYNNGLTMSEIAEKLNLSRQSVGRHIQRAKERGIVRISIHSPLSRCTELENALEEKFQLKEAIVVTPLNYTNDSVIEALGVAGAEFLERVITPGDSIGVSWSTSVLALADNLNKIDCEGISVVQMNGSLNRGSISTRADYIIDKIARAFDADQLILPAPMIVDFPEIFDSLMRDSQFSSILDQARSTSIALYGVGDISRESSLYKTGYIDDELLSKLYDAGAVGDICGHFYNKNGKICLPDLDKRTIAIELSNLGQKRVSIAIAGLSRKVQAIKGMLSGKFCNVLITDDDTSKILLEKL